MKQTIEQWIKEYVREYQEKKSIQSRWKEPIVAFASAVDPDFMELKKIVHPEHVMPGDVIEDAKTVVSYFIPFEEQMANSNIGGVLSSVEWARAYTETNTMMHGMNEEMIRRLQDRGYRAGVSLESKRFDKDLLLSRWSQRHIAKIAGLGTFGRNNLLITQKGCCGRYSSIVMSIEVEPSEKIQGERCLHKQGKSCEKCRENCPTQALKHHDFVRSNCYELCEKNSKIHKDLSEPECCGKCAVNIPCQFKIP